MRARDYIITLERYATARLCRNANKVAESSAVCFFFLFSLDADVRGNRGTALEIEFHGARVSLMFQKSITLSRGAPQG